MGICLPDVATSLAGQPPDYKKTAPAILDSYTANEAVLTARLFRIATRAGEESFLARRVPSEQT